jgi:hypothetical protein
MEAMRDFRPMTPSRLLRGWHARSLVIAAVLLVTLGVAATLAYQAQQAVRSHRATAENVLRDYAALAGDELTRRTERELHDVIGTQLTRLASSCDGRDRLPTLDQWIRVKDT